MSNSLIQTFGLEEPVVGSVAYFREKFIFVA